MGLARAAGLPVIVVGDIDRGGVFAAMYGTLALLEPADQALIVRVRDQQVPRCSGLLEPGLTHARAAHRPAGLGVLPWRDGLGGDAEDSLALDLSPSTRADRPVRPKDFLRVCVVRLPRISNFTDVDALAAEPGVLVRFADRRPSWPTPTWWCCPGPGPPSPTWAGCASAAWPRRSLRGPGPGGPVLGICGGYQMLAGRDRRPGGIAPGRGAGLGLLPVRVAFGRQKVLGRPHGQALGAPVAGYEIHHGVAEITDPAAEPFLDGCRRGAVWGTSWHGALENNDFRRAFLTEVAALAGRDFTPAPGTDFAAVRRGAAGRAR